MRKIYLAMLVLLFSSATFAQPLLDAVRSNDLEATRDALVSGPEINVATTDGTTALMWAVHNDQAELVELLLQKGADVRLANRYGVGPASLAAE
ncbi:MAG: ankyrin repeat domain-containing protein, partial [Gammaproteobacteria bacterium]|nr:ankyrin repeat domain-containing protein [Gammaproteobacteria bacterium]